MSSNYSIHHNARLASIAGNYAAGTCLVQTTAGDFVIATSANRTLYGKSSGVMRTAGDGTRNRMVDFQFCGLVPASVASVGAGNDTDYVRVSAAGFPERVAAPGAGDDVIGKAKADGSWHALFGGTMNTSSGGGTPAGGTGAVQYNNAGAFAAIAPNAAFGKPLVSNGAGVPPIYDSISLANNAAVVAPGAASEVLVNDGTGAVSSAPGVKAGSNYISIGTNPAASGGFRAANNVAWMARNAANSADRQLCALNASDVVVLGDAACAMTINGSGIDVGSQNITTTGKLRRSASLVIADSDATTCYVGCDNANSSQFTVLQLFSSSAGYLGTGLTFLARWAGDGIQLFSGTASFGGGVMVLGVKNATTNPSSNPTGGGILYADAGAGKWRGSGGTVTTFGPAEPHCPRCGTDVGVSQSENDLFGEELIHCHACEIRTGNGVVVHVADFFERRKAA